MSEKMQLKKAGLLVGVLIIGAVVIFALMPGSPSEPSLSVKERSKEADKSLASSDSNLHLDKNSSAAASPHDNQATDGSRPSKGMAPSQAIVNQHSTTTAPGQAMEQPAVDGAMAQAHVNVGKKKYELTPNQVGGFDRVYVEPREKVHVELIYPEAEAGEVIALQAEDGGMLDNGSIVQVVKLDKERKLAFNFQVTEQQGTHRITLTRAGDRKFLDFWVGEELPVAQ